MYGEIDESGYDLLRSSGGWDLISNLVSQIPTESKAGKRPTVEARWRHTEI